MPKILVLVFPCGAENGIEVHQALKDVMNIELFGASSRDDHGADVFKNYVNDLPLIHEKGFMDRFNVYLEENAIDIIIPTHDDIALHLARHGSEWKPRTSRKDCVWIRAFARFEMHCENGGTY